MSVRFLWGFSNFMMLIFSSCRFHDLSIPLGQELLGNVLPNGFKAFNIKQHSANYQPWMGFHLRQSIQCSLLVLKKNLFSQSGLWYLAPRVVSPQPTWAPSCCSFGRAGGSRSPRRMTEWPVTKLFVFVEGLSDLLGNCFFLPLRFWADSLIASALP
jgi:hypothetical protein